MPTAVGGGFGSKLDLSLQPFVAVAAFHLERPVRMVYSRTESMMTTTKRHPARIKVRAGANRDGKLMAMDFCGDFNTGAYASFGPTVANRVPVHASGPYFVPHYRALARAIHTHVVPAGAFRGFGVPQTAIAQEQLYDELALRIGMDRLEFRIANALDATQPTVTGQVIGKGVGIRACLEALRPHWARALQDVESYNKDAPSHLRRGAGVAAMWYGCGNTSLPNPSTIRAGLKPDGRVALASGRSRHRPGIQYRHHPDFRRCAGCACGPHRSGFGRHGADTRLRQDVGFAPDLRHRQGGRACRPGAQQRDLAGSPMQARGRHSRSMPRVRPSMTARCSTKSILPGLQTDEHGYVIMVEETFNPPTTALDENGQGDPYAVYGFGAHLAEIEIDVELGKVKVLKITAAHDVGRAINPTLIEGQVEGGARAGTGHGADGRVPSRAAAKTCTTI